MENKKIGSNMEENEVIRHLKGFPAGNIYHVTPKQYLVSGFQYYQTGRVENH